VIEIFRLLHWVIEKFVLSTMATKSAQPNFLGIAQKIQALTKIYWATINGHSRLDNLNFFDNLQIFFGWTEKIQSPTITIESRESKTFGM